MTFLDHLYEVEQIRGPFLIAVPLSTIEHWKREFEGNFISNSIFDSCDYKCYNDAGGSRPWICNDSPASSHEVELFNLSLTHSVCQSECVFIEKISCNLSLYYFISIFVIFCCTLPYLLH